MHLFKFSSLAILFAAIGWGAAAHAGGPAMTKNFFAPVAFDAPDADLGDGECNISPDPNGPKICTLRAAIMQGNTYGPGWEIGVVLIPGMQYTLSIPGAHEQLSATGDLDVLRLMRIGVPKDSLENATVDINSMDRGFHFSSQAGASVLYGIDLVGGASSGNWNGSVIYSEAPNLELERLRVYDNVPSALVRVGGGSVTAKQSRFDHNDGSDGYPRVFVVFGPHALVIENSSVDSNSGFAFDMRDGASLDVRNSTISNNSYHAFYSSGASMLIENSTIVNNGGVAQLNAFPSDDFGVIVEVRNSIFFSDSGSIANCIIHENESDVSFVTAYNIYSDNSCVSSDTFFDGSQHNADPGLSELGNWGGPTPTHKPLPGSIAIDRAPASLCAQDGTDQRGLPRPVAHIGNVEPRCDTGAVELEALVVPEEPWVPEIFLDGFEG